MLVSLRVPPSVSEHAERTKCYSSASVTRRYQSQNRQEWLVASKLAALRVRQSAVAHELSACRSWFRIRNECLCCCKTPSYRNNTAQTVPTFAETSSVLQTTGLRDTPPLKTACSSVRYSKSLHPALVASKGGLEMRCVQCHSHQQSGDQTGTW